MDDRSQFLQLLEELGVNSDDKSKIISSPLTKFENDRLIWLDLGCINITRLPEGIFDGFSDLVYLGLYGNKISSIPERYFSCLKNLEYLDLGENNLTELPNELFDSDNSLRYLWIYSNRFENLSASMFRNLSGLKELNLNSAIQGTIDWNLFSYLPNLERLEIALNQLENIPMDKLPSSLKVLIIDKPLPSGGITIIDLLQEKKSKTIKKTSYDTFCLVTGLMGSGKSTIMKQLPYQKFDGYPPKTDTPLFFDNLFALERPDGYSTIFFELDGPTILSWHQFIGTSDVVVQVIRFDDIHNNIDEVVQLAEHILKHKSEKGKFFLAISYFPEDIYDDNDLSSSIPQELTSQIDEIFKIPPGKILPDVGGNRKVILQKESLMDLCNAIFQVKPSR
ncbi:MAG: leucine-rich repeat domain-containing protein [Methanobacteriota archaeon]|nr:MAG: leucine-rich repeat domain-containing protein [Euryarchaeota archaeon]